MRDLTKMLKEVKKLLIENKLEDLSSYFSLNDEIVINTGVNSLKFQIRNEPIMVNGSYKLPVIDENGDAHLIDINSYSGKKIKIDSLKPKSDTSDNQTKKSIIGVHSIAVSMPSKNIILKNIDEIDINQFEPEVSNEPENTSEPNKKTEKTTQTKLEEFQKILSNTTRGDLLSIYSFIPEENTEEEEDNGEETWDSKTEIFLEVIKSDNRVLQVVYSSSEGDKSTYFKNELIEEEITINIDDALVIKNNEIILGIYVNDEVFTIKGIQLLFKNKNINGTPAMSSIKLSDKIRADRGFRDLFLKRETPMDTLLGRSPLGIFQLYDQIMSNKLKNSYFTKGKIVHFNLLSGEIKDNNGSTLRPNKNYSANIISNTKFRLDGNRNQNHWIVEIINEKDNMEFEVKFTYHKKLNNPGKPHKGTIKVTDISK